MESKQLNRMTVKGFKSIRDASVELTPLNVLIGANGAGKSNFISLFRLINKIVDQNLQIYIAESGGIDSFVYFGQKQTESLYVKLDFGHNSYEFSLIPTRDNTLIFSYEHCYFHGSGYEKPYQKEIGQGQKETMLFEKRSKGNNVTAYVLQALCSWKVYHFHDTSEKAKVRNYCNVNDNQRLKPDASNIAAFLYLLKEKYPDNYNNIIHIIQLAAPFFEDFILRPNPYNNELIQLEWKERGTDSYFNAHSFSDGTLRFICLVTLLMQPQMPSTILLDEPELGLHPYAIALLAGLLQSAAKKTQVIVSTQSVTLVNQFIPADIIVVDKADKQTVFKRLKEEDMTHWLDEYGLGDLWEKNIIGGRP